MILSVQRLKQGQISKAWFLKIVSENPFTEKGILSSFPEGPLYAPMKSLIRIGGSSKMVVNAAWGLQPWWREQKVRHTHTLSWIEVQSVNTRASLNPRHNLYALLQKYHCLLKKKQFTENYCFSSIILENWWKLHLLLNLQKRENTVR